MRQARLDGEEHLLDLRQGDVFQPAISDAEWGTFDVAHTRFLLEHLNNPLGAVQNMVRAVRRAGA